jgi:hypothetical protein
MKRLKLLFPLAFVILAFSQLSAADSHKKEEMMKSMTHVTIMHEVEDADHWFAAWRGEDSRHKMFKANGAKHVHTMQDPDNPNMTGLIIAVADMEAFTAFLQSDRRGEVTRESRKLGLGTIVETELDDLAEISGYARCQVLARATRFVIEEYQGLHANAQFDEIFLLD